MEWVKILSIENGMYWHLGKDGEKVWTGDDWLTANPVIPPKPKTKRREERWINWWINDGELVFGIDEYKSDGDARAMHLSEKHGILNEPFIYLGPVKNIIEWKE